MGLLDGYVSGRFAKNVQPDYYSIESKLGGEHLITRADSDLTLDMYVDAVSKGKALHPELANVSSMIKYKLNELKTTRRTEEAYQSALEALITQSKNVVVGHSFRRSNAHERPWFFKSRVGIDILDENIVAKHLNVNVEGAGIIYAGAHSRFDLYETSSRDLLRGVLDEYLFVKDAYANKSMPKDSAAGVKHAAKPQVLAPPTTEDIGLATSIQKKYNAFVESLTDEEEHYHNSKMAGQSI